MNSTKVIQLLSSLDPKEIKAFRKYLYSPYFNTHKETAIFFDLMYESDPSFTNLRLDLTAVFSILYPDKEFNESSMRMLRKYLFKHLINFLGQREYEKQSIEQNLHQLNGLLSVSESKFFNGHANKLKKELNKNQKDSSRNYLNSYRFENLMVHFQTVHSNRWETKNFRRANETLNRYYAIEKLRLYCSQINESIIFEKELENDPIVKIIIEECKKSFDRLPLVMKAYFCMVMIGISNEKLDYFFLLKKHLPLIHTYCAKNDIINIYNFLINSCCKLYLRGKLEFQAEMFALYKEMLEYELLFKFDLLSINHYKNISTLGLRLGEFAWTKVFIDKYKDSIDEKYREAVYAYSIALWHFYHQNYSESLKCLQQMVFIDPFYKISHDLLLLRVYFEQNEKEAFMALCLNFQNFIRRKKMLENDQQKAYLNFIQSARALFLVKIGERKNLDKAVERLEKSEVIVEKVWLTEKVQQLTTQ